jgi:hypothetical protein
MIPEECLFRGYRFVACIFWINRSDVLFRNVVISPNVAALQP